LDTSAQVRKSHVELLRELYARPIEAGYESGETFESEIPGALPA
jgi:hypothetical protein